MEQYNIDILIVNNVQPKQESEFWNLFVNISGDIGDIIDWATILNKK